MPVSFAWLASAVPNVNSRLTGFFAGHKTRFVSARRYIHEYDGSKTMIRSRAMKLIDIGANLTDSMFKGHYNDKQYHPEDLKDVLGRAWAASMERIVVTAGSLNEAKAALDLARTDGRLFCTAGVHPTRCNEIFAFPEGPEEYMRQLEEVIKEGVAEGKIVAIGECGLDNDRLHFCDAETQKKGFELHFPLAEKLQLPMFLHCRAAANDMVKMLTNNRSGMKGAVIHSFDGSLSDLQSFLAFDRIFIGINGCSLKTDENLDVMAAVPVDRLMIETDAPWCEVRPTHAGWGLVHTRPPAKDRKKWQEGCMVKGRNEPASLVQVLEIVAGENARSFHAILFPGLILQ
eukprot:jgi/Botrbrau1/15565/Bobra.0274s0008.2